VAHEFKNPLAAIRTAAETIAESASEEERQRFHRMLLRDVDRLEALIAGVRELAHVDAEVSGGRRASVDLGALLRTIVDGRRLVSAVPIDLEAPSKPVRVVGSHERLTQVFVNLLDNAASFAPQGTAISITVVLQGRHCVVLVADRGSGIPAEHVDRVFDRFFSYRPGSDRREHMGLGLAIAKAVVTGYGGNIAARNRPGGGAEFSVSLPLTIQ
jgi:two-component system sensor histidine kinase ChvG